MFIYYEDSLFFFSLFFSIDFSYKIGMTRYFYEEDIDNMREMALISKIAVNYAKFC